MAKRDTGGVPRSFGVPGFSLESILEECRDKAPEETAAEVYITVSGKKYHRGSCAFLKKSKIGITLQDAKSRGYTPCSKCKPPQ